jgi:predicted ATP-dependent serine protease
MKTIEDLTREEKIDFLRSPVWEMVRQSLWLDKETYYAAITNENTRVSEVKSKADKLAVIDSIFALENEIIKSIQGA